MIPRFSLPRSKRDETLATLYFGASYLCADLYLLPDGEVCHPDGTLYLPPTSTECWLCAGARVVKVYLPPPGNGFELEACRNCGGTGHATGAMPELRPRHIHDWQPSEADGCPPRFEPQRCECGAVWLKKSERKPATGMVAGMKPLASLLKGA